MVVKGSSKFRREAEHGLGYIVLSNVPKTHFGHSGRLQQVHRQEYAFRV
jgi:hypothetical protein